jgi:ISXO2-like transposase domain
VRPCPPCANGIESAWAVLERGHYGTYHHFSLKHLQRYIDEFAFRLNEGNCKVPPVALWCVTTREAYR